MTDLNLAPDDLRAHIEATAHAAGLSYLTAASSSGDKGSRMDAFRAGVAWVISDPAFTSLLADRARMEKAHQRLVDDLVAKANEARALAADLHNKPAKAHLTDPALGRMAYAMAAKCDHFIEAAEIARQALGASQ